MPVGSTPPTEKVGYIVVFVKLDEGLSRKYLFTYVHHDLAGHRRVHVSAVNREVDRDFGTVVQGKDQRWRFNALRPLIPEVIYGLAVLPVL